MEEVVYNNKEERRRRRKKGVYNNMYNELMILILSMSCIKNSGVYKIVLNVRIAFRREKEVIQSISLRVAFENKHGWERIEDKFKSKC